MVPFDQLLRYLHECHKDEFVRRMRQQRIPQPTWSTWINRGSVPRANTRKFVFLALAGLVARDEVEASLAISDRCIAMTGGYAGEVDRALLIERHIVELERGLAQLREAEADVGRAATTHIYSFVSHPLVINAVAAAPPCINSAPKVYKKLVQARGHYGAILAKAVPGLRSEHYEEVFRLVVRLCAGSVHEVFRPWRPERRLLPRAVAGATGRRSDQDEMDEIHRAVLATAWFLAAQAGLLSARGKSSTQSYSS